MDKNLKERMLFELNEVDADIRELYINTHFGGYPFGFPTKMQHNRLLVALIKELEQCHNRCHDCCRSKDNIKPENFTS